MRKTGLLLGVAVGLWGCHHTPAAPEGDELPPGRYEVRTLAFYNVENLFDTQNDTLVMDDDRTPEGSDRWTSERYEDKLDKIAAVLSGIGRTASKRSPDLIGLCEVENHAVLEALLKREPLKTSSYGIVHYDSPDRRGIDVALLYNKNVYVPIESQSRRLLLRDDHGQRKYTRDQLVVYGYLDGEPLYVSVNHWPSRSGGKRKSEPFRRQAAALQRSILDSVLRIDPNARFVSLGDYNDDPQDISIRYGMGTRPSKDSLSAYDLFNPMEALFDSGIGSLAYRDRWNLFDQILFNGNWFLREEGYTFWKAQVFRTPELITQEGVYKGYPFRTYAGGQYMGGYSDHFPVYAFLVRPASGPIPK